MPVQALFSELCLAWFTQTGGTAAIGKEVVNMNTKTAIFALALASVTGIALAAPDAEAGERGYERGLRHETVERGHDKRGYRGDRDRHETRRYSNHRYDGHWHKHHRHDRHAHRHGHERGWKHGHKWDKPRAYKRYRHQRYSYWPISAHRGQRYGHDDHGSTSITIRWRYYD